MSQPLAEPLLPADAPSRDLEACASDSVPEPMRCFTGTFDDPTLEAAFAALAFRDAFLLHVGLLALATAFVRYSCSWSIRSCLTDSLCNPNAFLGTGKLVGS